MSRALMTSVLMAIAAAYVVLAILVGPLWALAIIAGGYLLTNITWTYYLAVMKLKWMRDRGRLTPAGNANAAVLLTLGLTPYVLFNWTVGSVLFLELPRLRWLRLWRLSIPLPEPQFTRRCQWHINNSKGWRLELALWCCHHLLDPAEEFGHCVRKQPPARGSRLDA